MIDLGKIWAQIRVDTTQFVSGLADAHFAMRNFEDAAENMMGVLTDLSKAAVVTGLEMANTFQKTEMTFTALSGSVSEAKAMMEEMKQFAVKTPFSFDEVSVGVRKMAAVGIELKHTIPLMEIFGDQVAALGGDSATLGRVVKAFTDMRAAGKVMAQDMNQFTNNGIAAWDALARHMGKTVGQVREQSRNGFISAKTAAEAILRDMVTKSGGSMTLMVTTLGGAFDQLKEKIAIGLGEAFLPLAEVLARLAPDFDDLSESAGRFMSPVIPLMIRISIEGQLWLKTFNAMPPIFKDVVFYLAALGAALVVAAVALGVFVFWLSAVVSAMVAVGGVIMAAGLPGIIFLITGVGTLISALSVLVATLAVVGLAWIQNWGNIRSVAKETFRAIIGNMQAFHNEMMDMHLRITKLALDSLLTLIDAWQDYIELSNNLPDWMVPDYIYDLADAVSVLENKLRGAQAKLDFKDLGGGMAVKMGENIGMAVSDVLATFAIDTKDEFLKLINSDLRDLFVSMLPDEARKVFTEFNGKFDELTSDAKERLMKFIDSLLSGWKDEPVKGKLTKDKFNAIDQIFAPIHSGLVDPIRQSVDEVTKSFQGVIVALEDLSSISEMLFGSIKRTAEGAIDWSATSDSISNSKVTSALFSDENSQPVFQGAMEGMAAGGPAGAAIGALTGLLMQTEVFTYAIETIGNIFGQLLDALNPLLNGIKPIINVVMNLTSIAMRLVIGLTLIQPILKIIGRIMTGVATALVPLMRALQMVLSSLQGGSSLLSDIIGGALDIAFKVLFYVFKGLGLAVLALQYVIGAVWNGIVWVVSGILKLLKYIPGLGKSMQKAIEAVEASKTDLDKIADNMDTLWNMTWDDAHAVATHTDSVEDATEAMDQMTEELLNVPEGYKVALARLNSAKGKKGKAPGGNSTGGGGGGGGGRDTDAWGDGRVAVWVGDIEGDQRVGSASGGRKPEDTVARTSQGTSGKGGGIVIEQLFINSSATNLAQLTEEIMRETQRKESIKTGRAPLPGLNGRFSTG